MEQGIYNGHETTLFVDFWLLASLNSPLTLPGTRALINVKGASPNSYRQLGFRCQYRHVPIPISFACNSRISV